MSHTSPASHHQFLSVSDLDARGITETLTLARGLKAGQVPGSDRTPLAGRAVALIFQKPSLRTRVSFEVGIARLGATPVVLVGEEVGLGSREVPRDVAHTLERYVDAIVARVFDHSLLEDLAAASRVPVLNALSDAEHPCQALADLMALAERWGGTEALAGRQLVYVGDGNNVAASLMLAGASVGLHVRIASPEGYEPDPLVVHHARHIAEESGARIELVKDPVAAVTGADAVYTDVWASMGQESEKDKRANIFAPYQVNRALFRLADRDAIFLHCLPAHRGDEVTADVIDSPQSHVFQQAENRLHAQKAIMLELMKGEFVKLPGLMELREMAHV